ncbi:MAG: hypothetical protein HN768_19210 [Rhodospirillaceae bacterium]|nr:hypothetical protein [Rhodospirillaceae bacterium]MBT7649167.1 hypothetical protein [Rhodospirillaceae bacterium]
MPDIGDPVDHPFARPDPAERAMPLITLLWARMLLIQLLAGLASFRLVIHCMALD